VPILFWRRNMTAADHAEAIETVDIMPTLAASMGLPVDAASIDGECLRAVQGITCP
jgi:arylsulfatase A-like enzyme